MNVETTRIKKNGSNWFKYLSGIKPTGELTLGNYLGVIKPASHLNNAFPNSEVLMFIADMHAFTVPQDPKDVLRHTEEMIKIFNMHGLSFFIQSHIPEHNQLGFIMEYLSKDWQLRNQIQYKQKKGKDTRASLLTYPALMAADCLLYDIDKIIVGEDQMSHIYLMHDLVESFEKEFGEGVINKPIGVVSEAAKIKDLRDPIKKMGKSSGSSGCIFLLEDPQVAYDKIIKAVTDSDNLVAFDVETKPGVSNLLTIYSGLTEKPIDKIIEKYKDLEFPYGDFKKDLAMIVKDFLVDFQEKYSKQSNKYDKELEKALQVFAKEKLIKIKNVMGLDYDWK